MTTKTPEQLFASRPSVEAVERARAWLDTQNQWKMDVGRRFPDYVPPDEDRTVEMLSAYSAHENTALRQEVERLTVECDRQWIAGAKVGWNYGMADNPTGLQQCISARQRDIVSQIKAKEQTVGKGGE